jgi:hypothetical protein
VTGAMPMTNSLLDILTAIPRSRTTVWKQAYAPWVTSVKPLAEGA